MSDHLRLPDDAVPDCAHPWRTTDAEEWKTASRGRWWLPLWVRGAQLRVSRAQAGEGRVRLPAAARAPARRSARVLATGVVVLVAAVVCLVVAEVREPEHERAEGHYVTGEFELPPPRPGVVEVYAFTTDPGFQLLESWTVERDGKRFHGYRGYEQGKAPSSADVLPLRVAGVTALVAAMLPLLRTGEWWFGATRLRRREVAARKVLVRAARPGRVLVHPADDDAGRLPMFVCRVSFPSGADDPDDRLSEAVLYGDLRAGAVVALTLPDASDGHRTEISASTLRRIRPPLRAHTTAVRDAIRARRDWRPRPIRGDNVTLLLPVAVAVAIVAIAYLLRTL